MRKIKKRYLPKTASQPNGKQASSENTNIPLDYPLCLTRRFLDWSYRFFSKMLHRFFLFLGVGILLGGVLLLLNVHYYVVLILFLVIVSVPLLGGIFELDWFQKYFPKLDYKFLLLLVGGLLLGAALLGLNVPYYVALIPFFVVISIFLLAGILEVWGYLYLGIFFSQLWLILIITSLYDLVTFFPFLTKPRNRVVLSVLAGTTLGIGVIVFTFIII